jgi:hypothetical protein
MKRLVLAAALLSLPGLAAAQDGGIVIGDGDFTVIDSPFPPGPIFTLPGFNIVLPPPGEPVNPNAMANLMQERPRVPLMNPDRLLLGEAPLVTVEEDGVRLPDEQFTLP